MVTARGTCFRASARKLGISSRSFHVYVISSAVICLRYLMLTKQRSLSSSTLEEGLPLRPCTLDILSLSCSPSRVLFTKFSCIFNSSPFKIRSDVSVVCYIFLAKHLVLCSISKVYTQVVAPTKFFSSWFQVAMPRHTDYACTCINAVM